MPNYTKLFNSIVTSTIWTEDDKTRIVWITMLAMSDQNGEVHASVPGLARVAGVTLADCELALGKLLGPDPYSRTPDNEGRRISPIDGGWELLNHRKYRAMASREDEKKANAIRQERFRNRHSPVTGSNATVTVSNGSVTPRNDAVTENLHIAEAKADSDTKAKEDSEENKPSSPKPKREAKPSKLTDEEWMAELKANEKYQGINIDLEFRKAHDWCQKNSRQNSRRFFENWLSKCEKPIAIKPKQIQPQSCLGLSILPDPRRHSCL